MTTDDGLKGLTDAQFWDLYVTMRRRDDVGATYDKIANAARAWLSENTSAGEAVVCERCPCVDGGRWVNADDVDRLVREMDIAINGAVGAAKQASLCDIAAQVCANKPPAKVGEAVVTEAMVERGARALARELENVTNNLSTPITPESIWRDCGQGFMEDARTVLQAALAEVGDGS